MSSRDSVGIGTSPTATLAGFVPLGQSTAPRPRADGAVRSRIRRVGCACGRGPGTGASSQRSARYPAGKLRWYAQAMEGAADRGPTDQPGSGSHSGSPAFELLPIVYAQLHAAAIRLMAGERRDHTLQATALVNEAFASLARDLSGRWPGPREFYLAAAEAMRHILVDHARRRGAKKRGGDRRRVYEIEGVLDLAREESIDDAMSLEGAILRLETVDARAAQVVRLRFYAGLTGDRVGQVLGISTRQAERDWVYARAFLLRELRSQDPDVG